MKTTIIDRSLTLSVYPDVEPESLVTIKVETGAGPAFRLSITPRAARKLAYAIAFHADDLLGDLPTPENLRHAEIDADKARCSFQSAPSGAHRCSLIEGHEGPHTNKVRR